jgi:hypothetical protein
MYKPLPLVKGYFTTHFQESSQKHEVAGSIIILVNIVPVGSF